MKLDMTGITGAFLAFGAMVALAPGPAFAGVSTSQGVDRLVNLSARGDAGTGENGLVAGFAIGGDSLGTQKTILVRGIGPSLGAFGVQGVLENPVLTFNVITGANPQFQASNTGWASQVVVEAPVSNVMLPGWGPVGFQAATAAFMSQAGAFPLSPASADSALVAMLPPGTFTASVTGANGATGVALAEIYDADGAVGNASNTVRLVNLSARANVGAGANPLVAGFVVAGSTTETLLVRAMGPSLAQFGLTGVLASPVVTVYDSAGLVVAGNTGWSTAPVAGPSPVSSGVQPATSAIFASVGAFQPAPTTTADSALVLTVPAGAYTVVVSGAAGATGVALVEIYELLVP
jgi:hypothetical protein